MRPGPFVPEQGGLQVGLLPWVLALGLIHPACRSSAPPGTPPSEIPIFREASQEVGLDFHHFTGATGEFFMPEIMGSGVGLVDYDNDGDLDVYLLQGAVLDESKSMSETLFPPPPGWKPGNRLFRNELVPSGKLQFTDVTDQAGVGHPGYGMGVATGDYDNDGDWDLYVTNFGSNVLYRNNGDGTFTDVTRQAGVDDARWSSSASFVDYDQDGHLDLYVANYIDYTVRGNKRCQVATGERDYCMPAAYRPVHDRLFRNQGNGRFRNVTEESGIATGLGPGLGVACADFNADGWVDIYVANDAAANLFWPNQGDGTFKEIALMSGTAYNAEGLPQAGMGVSAGDFDNDGDEDLLVANLTLEGCVLYRNDGKANFYDATAEVGLLQTTFSRTGFGTEWFDYDNDGHLDIFLAAGAVTMIESLRGTAYPFHQPNQLIRNEGDGMSFRDTTSEAGPIMDLSEVSRGAAFGDIDNDGDIDIGVTNNNGPFRLLLNQVGASSHWVQIRLEASEGNRFGIGARVAVRRAGRKTLWRRVHTDSSYLSANDVRLHFGLGEEPEIEAIVVQWPDGSREEFNATAADILITLRQGTGSSVQSQ